MRRKIQLELAFPSAGAGEARERPGQGTEADAANAVSESPAAMAGRAHGSDCRSRQSEEGAGASPAQQGSAGDRRHERRSFGVAPERPLAGASRPAARRLLPTAAGEAGRRYRKASGGTRPLGIPTVLDRFVQQAAMQVLQAEWDGTFSASSYGFRPGRSAHQAVRAAQDVHCVGPSHRRGHRPGEVLRPGQPRHPDGAGGQAGVRSSACCVSSGAS